MMKTLFPEFYKPVWFVSQKVV